MDQAPERDGDQADALLRRVELEQRVERAMDDVVQARIGLHEARTRRDVAIADLRVAGATVREVADLTDLSVGMISMIDTKLGVVTQRTVTRTEDR